MQPPTQMAYTMCQIVVNDLKQQGIMFQRMGRSNVDGLTLTTERTFIDIYNNGLVFIFDREDGSIEMKVYT